MIKQKLWIILFLAACSSVEIPKDQRDYLAKETLFLNVKQLENKNMVAHKSQETAELVEKIFQWKSKRIKPVGDKNSGVFMIDRAIITPKYSDDGFSIHATADIRLSISSEKESREIKVSAEKNFHTQKEVSAKEKSKLTLALIEQLIFKLDEELEKNIGHYLNDYILIDHNQKNRASLR